MTTAPTPTPTATPTADDVAAAWDRLAAGFDQHVTPVNHQLAEQALDLAEVTAETAVLDVAAGSGALAIPAARRGASVVAVDLSPGMIDRLAARADTEGLDRIDARVMDGMALDLDDDTFDVAASQHGVSLFPDVGAGLAEMVRVTRPGGRVVVVAFGPLPQAEFLTFFFAALRRAVPGFSGPPMSPPPLPFQLAGPGVLAARLQAAGLADVRVEPTTSELPCEDADHLWRLVTSSNPIAGRLLAGIDDEAIAAAKHAVTELLDERADGGDVAILRTAVAIGLGTVTHG